MKIIETDLPASELDTFVDLALKARSEPISSVSFVPPAIVTADPDIDKIRAAVEKAVDPPEASDEGSDRGSATPAAKPAAHSARTV